MRKPFYYIVQRTSPQGGSILLRLFSDGADAYRFAAAGSPLGRLTCTLITDASSDVDGRVRPHEHYWAVHSWTWANYRWENREPVADCIPIKDSCPCGEQRRHIDGTPWPPMGPDPMPDYATVRAEAGPRPRAPRRRPSATASV